MKEIIVLAEHRRGELRDVTWEMLSKGRQLAESMGAELRNEGINVNCILPGTIDTPQNRKNMPNADFSRWVSPESLAEVIFFLTSDAAQDLHGAAVPVYGRSG